MTTASTTPGRNTSVALTGWKTRTGHPCRTRWPKASPGPRRTPRLRRNRRTWSWSKRWSPTCSAEVRWLLGQYETGACYEWEQFTSMPGRSRWLTVGGGLWRRAFKPELNVWRLEARYPMPGGRGLFTCWNCKAKLLSGQMTCGRLRVRAAHGAPIQLSAGSAQKDEAQWRVSSAMRLRTRARLQ